MTDKSLDILTEQSKPPVPTFSLTVFVGKTSGGYSARVANLTMDEIQASSPRDALSKIVPKAKAVIATCYNTGKAVPWIDPANAKRDAEQQFLVPIHL